MNCPKILGRLGSSVLLPLTSQGISKSMNESIHILVAKAESQGSSVKKKIVSLSLPEGSSVGYLEDGYKFHLENLSLEIPESRKKDEGWYIMTLEGNISVQHFCLQLKLYGNGGFPRDGPLPKKFGFSEAKGLQNWKQPERSSSPGVFILNFRKKF